MNRTPSLTGNRLLHFKAIVTKNRISVFQQKEEVNSGDFSKSTIARSSVLTKDKMSPKGTYLKQDNKNRDYQDHRILRQYNHMQWLQLMAVQTKGCPVERKTRLLEILGQSQDD